MTKEQEKNAPFWQILLDRTGNRDNFTCDFHRSRNGQVLWVLQPVDIYFDRDGEMVRWSAEPGDLILREHRPLSPGEKKYVHNHSFYPMPQSTAIGALFNDSDALETALRREVRQIPDALIGKSDRVDNATVVVPGAIDRAQNQAARSRVYEQYIGVIKRAAELWRIQDKIEDGFKSAYKNLGLYLEQLQKARSPEDIARITQRVANLWVFIQKVATINPYYRWAHNTEVFYISRAIEAKPESLQGILVRALSSLDKGWRGRRVTEKEVRNVRQRAKRMSQ